MSGVIRTRVRSRRPCRMISCPAATGIRCVKPSSDGVPVVQLRDGVLELRLTHWSRSPPLVPRSSELLEAIRPPRAGPRCPAHADAHVATARCPPRSPSSSAAASASRAPLAPSGCPSAIAPPFGLTCSASSGSPARAAPQGLRGEGLVELDDVDVVDLQPGPVEQLAGGGLGTDAHDSWWYAGSSGRRDSRQRRRSVLLHRAPTRPAGQRRRR